MNIASRLARAGNGQRPSLNGFLSLADAWIARMTDEPRLTWFRRALDQIAQASTEAALATSIGLAWRLR